MASEYQVSTCPYLPSGKITSVHYYTLLFKHGFRRPNWRLEDEHLTHWAVFSGQWQAFQIGYKSIGALIFQLVLVIVF